MLQKLFIKILLLKIQLSVDSQNDFDVIKLIIDLSNNKPGGWRELAILRKSIYL